MKFIRNAQGINKNFKVYYFEVWKNNEGACFARIPGEDPPIQLTLDF